MIAAITGAGGQLGWWVQRTAPSSAEVVGFTRKDLDISDEAQVDLAMDRLRPDLIFNCAAYTNVDGAESEPGLAFAINAAGPANLARAAARTGGRLIHVSTDYVFDGTASTPYSPEAETAPLNVYGASKLAGEKEILAAGGEPLIVRTAWLYAIGRRNFVTTMLRLLGERDEIRVVADQVGSPTHCRTLASGLWKLAEGNCGGIFHLTDAGVASWYDFAQAIKEEGSRASICDSRADIIPIMTSEYPTPAKRPSYSVLDQRSTWEKLGWRPQHWRVELREALERSRG